jgi:hypothetical protein
VPRSGLERVPFRDERAARVIFVGEAVLVCLAGIGSGRILRVAAAALDTELRHVFGGAADLRESQQRDRASKSKNVFHGALPRNVMSCLFIRNSIAPGELGLGQRPRFVRQWAPGPANFFFLRAAASGIGEKTSS